VRLDPLANVPGIVAEMQANDVRPGLGEGDGDGRADPARGAGHHRAAAGERGVHVVAGSHGCLDDHTA
jgi:hypothetical protein